MIELKDIKKGFGKQEVLKGISINFHEGKTSLIIGASGSGKTVLLKCMVGLIEVDDGNVLYNGRDLTKMDYGGRKKIRMEMGMLFQGNALFTSKTVEENIAFPMDMFTSSTAKEKRMRVDEVLERVNLSGVNNKFPAEISGGMQKRVGIARAIVLKPKYLFCDEPNSGLDPQTSLLIDHLIKDFTTENNITTIINTHDMNSVMGIGDKILFLHQGKKHWEGNNKEIMRSKNKELEDFIFASDFLKRAREVAAKED